MRQSTEHSWVSAFHDCANPGGTLILVLSLSKDGPRTPTPWFDPRNESVVRQAHH